MDPREIDKTIAEFKVAREQGEYFPTAWKGGRLSIDDAYRVQLGLIRERCAKTRQRQIGWKVGLTAKAIQEQFGFNEPVFGCLLEEGNVPSGHSFRFADLIRPGFENELCIELKRDVPPNSSFEAVSSAIGAIRPALEIIETRGDFVNEIALALADNAQQFAFVIGDPVPVSRAGDIAKLNARVRLNGAEVGSGRGDAVLGHPFNSVAWLATKLQRFGEKLRTGDFIMTGSFTRQFPIASGDRVETNFEGLGKVSAAFV
ncbi:MAG: fumarylacetoacetate hydrolase family protein [Hyphomicrobiales bacterium]|nr:fumarylacetoacetate hydrolase family protein [Hyphomicrobiales bacterium]MBV9977480.1 fumarylacetoacetate hydrolase family protein [Hyphomicrobiales bacterium]